MSKDQSNQELNFKKQARRRLVGAIALVLLMIIILPMVLKDRSLTDFEQDITITLDNEVALNQADPSGFDSTVIPEDQVSIIQNETIIDEKIVELSLQTKPAAKKTTKAEEKKPITKQADEKKKEKLAEVKKGAPKVTSASQYFVQIGVFSDPTNVKKLQMQLDELGYQSLTEKVDTSKGEKTRLRTTLFDGKNEAAIALENIKDAGLTGLIVSKK